MKQLEDLNLDGKDKNVYLASFSAHIYTWKCANGDWNAKWMDNVSDVIWIGARTEQEAVDYLLLFTTKDIEERFVIRSLEKVRDDRRRRY